MRYFICLLLLHMSSGACYAQDGKTLLEKMIATLKQHESLSYTASMQTVYASSNDTSVSQATVHLLREASDTIWGGMVWIGEGTKPETYAFYDLDKRYVVMTPIGKVWKERPRKGDMGLSISYKYMIFQPFLQPDVFQQSLKDYQVDIVADDNVNGQPCYVVALTRPGTGTSARYYYLNKQDCFPMMIMEKITIDGKAQHSRFSFITHSFDNIAREQFSAKQIPISYKIDSRDREVPKGVQPQVRPREQWPLPGNRRR